MYAFANTRMGLHHSMELCVDIMATLLVDIAIALFMKDALGPPKRNLFTKGFRFSEKKNYVPKVIAISYNRA